MKNNKIFVNKSECKDVHNSDRRQKKSIFIIYDSTNSHFDAHCSNTCLALNWWERSNDILKNYRYQITLSLNYSLYIVKITNGVKKRRQFRIHLSARCYPHLNFFDIKHFSLIPSLLETCKKNPFTLFMNTKKPPNPSVFPVCFLWNCSNFKFLTLWIARNCRSLVLI